MKWNGTLVLLCWPMHVCPILTSVLPCCQHVSYTKIKGWRKFQNATQFLKRASLLLLIFQLNIKKRQRIGLPMELSLLFQRNYSTKSILPCLRCPFEQFCLTIFWSADFTSSAALDFWQGTGETSIKHLISSCHSLIWVVYDIFWMKNLNQLVNQFDTQKLYSVSHGQHLTLLWWYWHSWLCWERAQAEICGIITRSAWNHCHLHSCHHSPCLHGFKGSRCPQHHLSWCCCTRTYDQMISWLYGRYEQYKHLPSLSWAIPSSPYSAPKLWIANALSQQVSEMHFYFLRFNYKKSTVSIICMSDL